jgi:putative RecB family exonuclease
MPRPKAPRALVLSPTRIRIFRECEAQYRLEYIDRLGRIFHRPRAGFSFGTSLHRTLEAFHAAGGAANVTAEELDESLVRLWIPEGYGSKSEETEYLAEAKRIVETYHREAVERAALPGAPPEPELLYAEKTLRFPIADGIALSGRIDRVDVHHDGSLEIVDYKSGRTEVHEDDVRGSLALGIYQLLLSRLHPDVPIRATIVALRTGASASHCQTADEREALEAECVEVGQRILAREWDSVVPVPCEHCARCDFKPWCERYWRRFGEDTTFS